MNIALLAADDYYNYTTTSSSSGVSGGLIIAMVLIGLAIAVIFIAALWRTFKKAGKPGWAAIVPFYNSYTLAQIGGKPGWWGIVSVVVGLIPFIGAIISLVMQIFIALGVGRNFRRGDAFSVILLALIPFGYLFLGFGKDQYVGDGQVYDGFNLPPTGGAGVAQQYQQPVAPAAYQQPTAPVAPQQQQYVPQSQQPQVVSPTQQQPQAPQYQQQPQQPQQPQGPQQPIV